MPGQAGDKHCRAPVGTTKLEGKSLPGLSVKHGVAFLLPAGMGVVWYLQSLQDSLSGWELKENTLELPAPSLETCLCTAFVPRFLSCYPACKVSECWRALPFLQVGKRNLHLFLVCPLMRCSRWAAAFWLLHCQPSHNQHVLCFSTGSWPPI